MPTRTIRRTRLLGSTLALMLAGCASTAHHESVSPLSAAPTEVSSSATSSAPTTSTSTSTTIPRPPGPPRVLFYGDSLAWESRNAVRFALRGVVVRQRIFWGTAICYWFPDMESQVATFRPDVVVAEFAGVDFASCVTSRAPVGSSPALITAAFRQDAIKATAILSTYGAEVIWVGGPVGLAGHGHPLQDMYQALAQTTPHASYVDAGDAVAPGHVFTWTLPCLPGEPNCHNGRETVRSPDGEHLCPVIAPGTVDCPVWSGGAFRFGVAIAAAVTRYLSSIGM